MVDYEHMPSGLVAALVATEDERFYEHSGIDFIALGRAIVKRGLMGQESAGGGSTITQQLAKQLYSKTAKTKMERLLQKPIEWVIAIKPSASTRKRKSSLCISIISISCIMPWVSRQRLRLISTRNLSI